MRAPPQSLHVPKTMHRLLPPLPKVLLYSSSIFSETFISVVQTMTLRTCLKVSTLAKSQSLSNSWHTLLTVWGLCFTGQGWTVMGFYPHRDSADRDWVHRGWSRGLLSSLHTHTVSILSSLVVHFPQAPKSHSNLTWTLSHQEQKNAVIWSKGVTVLSPYLLITICQNRKKQGVSKKHLKKLRGGEL